MLINKKKMGTRFLAIFSVIFFTFFSIDAISASDDYIPQDLNQLKNELSIIKNKVKVSNYKDLLQEVQAKSYIKYKLYKSIESDKSQLNKINLLISKFNEKSISQSNAVFYKSLLSQRDEIVNHILSAEIIDYDVNILQKEANKKVYQLNPYNVRIQEVPIWQKITPRNIPDLNFNKTTFYQISGIEKLSNKNILFGLFLTIACSLFASFIFQIGLNRFNKKTTSKTNFIYVMQVFKQGSYYIFLILFVALYLNVLFYHSTSTPIIIKLINSILIYAAFITLIKLDLAIDPKTRLWPNAPFIYSCVITFFLLAYNYGLETIAYWRPVIPLNLLDLRFFSTIIVSILIFILLLSRNRKSPNESVIVVFLKRIRVVATLTLLYFIIAKIFDGQQIPAPLFGLYQTFCIIFLNLALLWINWIIFKTKFFKKMPIYVQMISKIILLVVYLWLIVAAWNGYHNLAIKFIPNLIISGMLIVILILLNRFLKKLYSIITDPRQKISQKLYRFLGVEPNKDILEFTIIRFLLLAAPIILIFITFQQLWGTMLFDTYLLFKSFKNGIHFDNFTLYPIRILRSCIIFCVLLLMGRYLTNTVSKSPKFSKDNRTRIMVRSLVHYLMFCIAFLCALVIAGINTSSLVVITGGLSFGLGFGLKQFASDAGSGLYIMFEKPFRVDDYISIGEIEGIVKHIGLLSTRIATPQHSNAILPNTLMIATSVINYTFLSNKLYRMALKIIIDNHKDIDKSKQLLLKVAEENAYVIKSDVEQPSVLMQGNHMTLECEIEGFTKRKIVSSELITSITKLFSEKDISFKFWNP